MNTPVQGYMAHAEAVAIPDSELASADLSEYAVHATAITIPWINIVLLVLDIAVAALDPILSIPVLAVVANVSMRETQIIAVGLFLISVSISCVIGLMRAKGNEQKGKNEASQKGLFWLTVAIWLAYGIEMALFRGFQDQLLGGWGNLVMAIMFLVLLGSSGLCIQASVRDYLLSPYHRYRPIEKRRNKAVRRTCKRYAYALQSVECLGKNTAEYKDLISEYQQWCAVMNDRRIEMKSRVRTELAAALGEPSLTTGIIKTPLECIDENSGKKGQ